jgi:hypothetical protein
MKNGLQIIGFDWFTQQIRSGERDWQTEAAACLRHYKKEAPNFRSFYKPTDFSCTSLLSDLLEDDNQQVERM